MEEYRFESVYEMANLIDQSVKEEVEFWNFNHEYFIDAATKFSKDTLLHQYIATQLFNHHLRYFRKSVENDNVDEIERWHQLLETYSIEIRKFDFEPDSEVDIWFEENEGSFQTLFDKIADEVFHVLFSNRKFLLDFNVLVSREIATMEFPAELLTKKGTIKRVFIPQWVKTAVFHRDKGRCIFCNIDLTGIVNTLSSKNFDHVVPLDRHGSNDPSNIQLTCSSCNGEKSNKPEATSWNYIPWWPR
jgi:hypothetical protein